MVQPDAVEAAIQQVIPDANVTVEDSLAAVITSR